MAVEVSKLVWDVELRATEKYVLLALADFASPDGSDVFPGTALLVRRTGRSDRTIRKVRRAFVERGILLEDRPPTSTSPGRYTINLAELRRLIGGAGEDLPPERRSPPEPDSAPERGAPPEREDRGGVNQVPGGGEPRSSKPPLEPPLEPPPAGSYSGFNDAIDAEVEAEWERTPRKNEIRSPEKYKATIRKRLVGEHRAEAKRRHNFEQDQAAIDECRDCNSSGVVLIEDGDSHSFGEKCSHNRDDYSGYRILTRSEESGEAVA